MSVRFSGPAPGAYGIVGDPAAMQREVQAFADAGATEIALAFGQTDAERARDDIERFDRDVLAAFR